MSPDTPKHTRATASSGRVDFTESVVIRGGPRATTHLEAHATFIPRSSGDAEVCLKLAYWKTKKGEFRVGFPAEFTLTKNEVIALRDYIDTSLALSNTENGQYLMIKLDSAESTQVAQRDAALVSGALLRLLSNPQLTDTLAELPNAEQLLEGLQTAVRIRSLSSAVEELRDAMNTGVTDEQFYQTWCENNAWAFGNMYVMRDDVRTIALGDSVDVLVERTTDRFRDIFELKRPDMSVLKYDTNHRSYYWARETSRTIGQCHRYIDALHEQAATGLRDHPEIIAYYPYATIVIGRSNDWGADQLKALHGLNARLHSLRVITYDHLLEQAERSLAVLELSDDQPEV
jgi:hypothetical protein